MKVTHIGAYRVIFPDGSKHYEAREANERWAQACDSIATLVKIVIDQRDVFMEENHGDTVHIVIDLKPFHSIEERMGLSPKRCLDLTFVEQDEFWSYYSSSRLLKEALVN